MNMAAKTRKKVVNYAGFEAERRHFSSFGAAICPEKGKDEPVFKQLTNEKAQEKSDKSKK